MCLYVVVIRHTWHLAVVEYYWNDPYCLYPVSNWFVLVRNSVIASLMLIPVRTVSKLIRVTPLQLKSFCLNHNISVELNFEEHCTEFSNGPVSFASQLASQYSVNQSVTFVKILIQINVRIYSYQQNYTNEYPNIFILIFLTRTNVRISIRIENCTNIRIYSNIRLGFTL